MVKWFGIESQFAKSPEFISFTTHVQMDTPEALGRLVLLMSWMAEHDGDGFLPNHEMVGRIVGLKGARADRFGRAVWKCLGDKGYFTSFISANGALMKNRERQRIKQQERRARLKRNADGA